MGPGYSHWFCVYACAYVILVANFHVSQSRSYLFLLSLVEIDSQVIFDELLYLDQEFEVFVCLLFGYADMVGVEGY